MELRDLVGVRRSTLRSALSADTARARIAELIDGPFNLMGSKPLIGTTSSQGASFRRRLGYRNSFQTVMDVGVEPQGATTTLRARSYMHPYAMVFMAIWFIGAGVATAALLLASTAPGSPYSPLFALFPLVFAAFGVLMVFVGRWFARDDHDLMLEAVIRATDATVVEAGGYRPRSAEELAASQEGPLNARLVLLFVLAVVVALGAAGGLFYVMGGPG